MSCLDCNEKTLVTTTTGSQGETGASGAFCVKSNYDQLVYSSPPNLKAFRFNNANPALVTNIFISNTDSLSVTVEDVLSAFDGGGGGTYGYIIISDTGNSGAWWTGEIIGIINTTTPTGYHDMTVSYIASNNWTGINVKNANICFAAKGPTGDDGSDVWAGVDVTPLDPYIPGFSGLADSAKQEPFSDHVASLSADVATNTADIATNTADIATNTADIATNTADIATNVADIATNTADIATNTADIATNAADILTNAGDITTIQTQLGTTPVVFDDEVDCPCEGYTVFSLLRNYSGIFPAASFSTEDTNTALHGTITAIGSGANIQYAPSNCDTADDFSFRVTDSEGNTTADATLTVNIAAAAAVPSTEVVFARFAFTCTVNNQIDSYDLDIRYGDPNGVSVSVTDTYSTTMEITSTTVTTAIYETNGPPATWVPVSGSGPVTFTGYVYATDDIAVNFLVNTTGSALSPEGAYYGTITGITNADVTASTVFDVELTLAS